MSEIFSRLDSTKKPTIIVRHIIDLVESGNLVSGSKLPSEMEIVRQTDISRSSIREALSALELMGIITRIPGEGTFISEAAPIRHHASGRILEKFLEDTERTTGSFKTLEARLILEPPVSAMAARRAEPEQIERLKSLICDSKTALEKNDVELFMSLDREFHIMIGEATNNDVISSISKKLLDRAEIRVYMYHKYKKDLGLLHKTVEAHIKILEGIMDKNPAKAVFYAENHLAECAV